MIEKADGRVMASPTLSSHLAASKFRWKSDAPTPWEMASGRQVFSDEDIVACSRTNSPALPAKSPRTATSPADRTLDKTTGSDHRVLALVLTGRPDPGLVEDRPARVVGGQCKLLPPARGRTPREDYEVPQATY